MQFTTFYKYVAATFLLLFGVALLFLHLKPTPQNPTKVDDERFSDITSIQYIRGESSSFMINGVPYIGFHNHVGNFSRFGSDIAAMTWALLSYWDPTLTGLVTHASTFEWDSRRGDRVFRHDLLDIKAKLDSLYGEEFVSGLFVLEQAELSRFINKDIRTPLFGFLPITTDQPENTPAYSAVIILGVDLERSEIVMHNFWLGGVYRVSLAEYQALQAINLPELQNKFLVVQPKNFYLRLALPTDAMFTPYESRPEVELAIQNIMKNFAIANAALLNRQYDVAKEYYLKIVSDTQYDTYAPPYLKMVTEFRLGDIFFRIEGDLVSGRKYIESAIEYNHDLDTPFLDWPGFEIRIGDPEIIDRVSTPYRILGDLEEAAGNLAAAEEAYQEALLIWSDDPAAQAGLDRVQSR